MAAKKGTEPNLYELNGAETQITYSTSSISGQPLFHYKDARHDVNVSGTEIRTQKSEIGRLITATIEQVPDLQTVTVTLLLPTINLEGTFISFRTKAILTTQRTSIGGPKLVKGALQSYRVLSLRGKARLVDF
jgi:hypothetical protein